MRGGYYAPTINIRLKCPKIDHTENYELFTLIDTGADCTVIMPSGAEILGIGEYELEKDKNVGSIRIAGNVYERRVMKDVDIFGRNGFVLYMPVIYALKLKGKESSGPIIEFHAIFGCDFLTHNRANLFFSPHKRSAYLEVE